MGYSHAYNLSDEELDEIRKDVKEHVSIACDEYHAHSALQGCCHSKEPDKLTIAKLLEYISILKWRINEATKKLKGE